MVGTPSRLHSNGKQSLYSSFCQVARGIDQAWSQHLCYALPVICLIMIHLLMQSIPPELGTWHSVSANRLPLFLTFRKNAQHHLGFPRLCVSLVKSSCKPERSSRYGCIYIVKCMRDRLISIIVRFKVKKTPCNAAVTRPKSAPPS